MRSTWSGFAPFLRATPLYGYAALDDLLGAEVFVKHENHLPTGAFKVRGGVNLVSRLDAGERERGVIAASTGNHGQSVAYAARLFGVRATIMRENFGRQIEILEFFRGLGVRYVCGAPAYSSPTRKLRFRSTLFSLTRRSQAIPYGFST